MTASDAKRTVRILGFGNPLAGDDAAGPLAAERLRARLDGRIEVIAAEMAGHALLDWMAGADAVLLIDATWSDRPPGSLTRCRFRDGRIEEGDEALPLFREGLRGARASSHGWSLQDGLALARSIGALPKDLIVYGVEVEDLTLGRPPGAAVLKAVDELVERVCRDVEALTCTKST